MDVATCAYLGVPTINKDNLCGSMNKAHTSATSYLAMAADIDQMEGTAANENRGEGLTQPTYHVAPVRFWWEGLDHNTTTKNEL